MAVEIVPTNVVIEQIDINLLQPHPRNVSIYGFNEDISELAKKIQEKGKLDYNIVITQNNRIISGHRRWQAAKSLGWSTIPVERRTYADELEELEALLIANVYRDKTTAQRGREYEVWLEVYKEKAKQSQGNRPTKLDEIQTNNAYFQPNLTESSPQKTKKITSTSNASKKKPVSQSRNQAANDAGLKATTADKVVKVNAVVKRLNDDGKTEEAQTLETELNRSADAAYKLISLPEDQLLTALHKLANNEVKTGKAAILEIKKEEQEAQVQAAPTKPKVTLSSWETWLPEQEPCDLLITDPPYSTDVEDIEAFANAWLSLALSKVKPTGRAYVCIGAYPHELKAYLNVQGCLPVAQVLVWSYRNTLGPSPKYDYKLNWQAILYFKGKEAPPIDCPIMTEQFSAQDINAPDGRQGDRYHAWQKPMELAEQLIRHSTRPGDRVIDCFTGTGTFLLAAHRLGRVASGCERSPEMAELARTRGCEVING